MTYWYSGVQECQEKTVLREKSDKTIDVQEKCAIILCSAINIPEQSYDAQYRAGGRLNVRLCQNVIVKENERR